MENNYNQDFGRDLISLFNTFLGLSNLEKNTEQNQKQNQIIQDLEKHLQEQDKQYEKIINLLERRENNDNRGNISTNRQHNVKTSDDK